ncbi:mRNA cleavage and polyadenylation factor subunit [Pseudocyphellaria aurata]|nr:mRNA cleavage and polyadenylation factor subunit [Pseudocyphellaria aurata]
MQCYTQLTPPTAVTHSLSLPFLSSSANNLIVTKTSLLQIFSVKSIITNANSTLDKPVPRESTRTRPGDGNGAQTPPLSSDQNTQRAEKLHTTKLVLVAQYDLSGTITAIARVKILRSKSGGEALLVALRDAKLSLIEWDPERYSIATVSIHLYEQENILRSPWEPDLGQSVSYLSVDPRSRCAALKFSARHMAILPFHQAGDDLVIDDYDPELDGEEGDPGLLPLKSETETKPTDKTPYAASFVLSLLALDPSLSHPLHLAFLYEYREPTFGIISSQFEVSAALQAERRDTISYTVFTLDLDQRASTTLLSVNGLPDDLFAVIPLPLPVGGALLVGTNELIHVDQAGKTNGVGVNNFAKHSTAFAMLDQADLGLRLEYCVIEQLGPDSRELLIILNNGELAVLNFKTDGRSVSGLSLRRIDPQYGGNAVVAAASCASVIGRGRMFVGSEKTDSIILGWSRKSDKLKRQRSRVSSNQYPSDEPLDIDEYDFDDDDDDDLYSVVKSDEQVIGEGSLPSSTAAGEDYIFRIHDSMQNCGPMRDVALRKSFVENPHGIQEARAQAHKFELLVSSGCGRAGGLTAFSREINVELVEQLNILDAIGVWTVYAREISEGGSAKAVNGDSATAHELDKYVIVSRIIATGEESSTAFKFTSTGLEEIKDTDFDPDAGATVEIGSLNSETRIVQVLPGELRTYDEGEFILVVPLHLLHFDIRLGLWPTSWWLDMVLVHSEPMGQYWGTSCVYHRHQITRLRYWLFDDVATVSFLSLHMSIASMKFNTNLSAPESKVYICAFCDCCNDTLADIPKGFGLAQIFPMTDDATGAEPKVISANFSDPYVLLVRDDFSVMVLRADESGDLDEVEQGEAVREEKWISGSLYEDSNDVLRLETGYDSEDEAGNVLMFLLSGGGGLQIFRLPNLKKGVYIADGLSFLPPFLSTEFTVRRSTARENLKEILIAELGDATHKSPYLILRSTNDDLTIYQPYQSPLEGSLDTVLRFLKTSSSLPRPAAEPIYEDEQHNRTQPLRALQDLDSYSVVFIPGNKPSLIIKSASSPPHFIGMRTGPVRCLSRLNTSKCEKGFVYIGDNGSTYAAKLPSPGQYSTGWVTRRIFLGDEVQALDFHQGKDSYVIGTNHTTDFKLSEDDYHNDSVTEDTTFLPQIDQGSIKLLDSKTWSIIDTHNLDPGEVVMCIKTVTLETSEHTHTREELVAVGTAVIRGEDLPSIGRIYVFSIIDVVPEPGRPETGRKLKLFTKEEVKGAVTSVSEIGSQGFLLVAQGSKCLVRGLKEDGTILPVAFMDMQLYITVAKELRGTGLIMTGDAFKGIWLAGYYEEPYQIRPFSKSPQNIEVTAADFLPDGKQLYMVVADADCNIHVLQFDPDNPKSLSGQRLLHLASFHTGHQLTTVTLLPDFSRSSSSAPDPSSSPQDAPLSHQDPSSSPPTILLTTQTGSLALLHPLAPSLHRTFAALQSHLQTALPHPLGLNPRAYRAGSSGSSGPRSSSGHLGGSGGAGFGGGGAGGGGWGAGGEILLMMGGGSVLDGGLLRRWGEGGSWKRWDGAQGEGGMGAVLKGVGAWEGF